MAQEILGANAGGSDYPSGLTCQLFLYSGSDSANIGGQTNAFERQR